MTDQKHKRLVREPTARERIQGIDCRIAIDGAVKVLKLTHEVSDALHTGRNHFFTVMQIDTQFCKTVTDGPVSYTHLTLPTILRV